MAMYNASPYCTFRGISNKWQKVSDSVMAVRYMLMKREHLSKIATSLWNEASFPTTTDAHRLASTTYDARFSQKYRRGNGRNT